MFKRIENKIDFAKNEDKISNYWSDIDAFQKSLDIRKAVSYTHLTLPTMFEV